MKQDLLHKDGVDEFDSDQVNGRRWTKSAKAKKLKKIQRILENTEVKKVKKGPPPEMDTAQKKVLDLKKQALYDKLAEAAQRVMQPPVRNNYHKYFYIFGKISCLRIILHTILKCII